MSDSGTLPAEVLSRAFGEAIAGRRVRAAVFTTFTFDPGFFELNVLPLLFEQPFSQVDKLKRVQLEDAMRSLDQVAIYYDRSGLAQEAEPAQLDYRRIDVARKTGLFHPKAILLLLDEPPEAVGRHNNERLPQHQSLLIGLASANLTRAGWWENVECAHFEEIKDRDADDTRCSYRHDLLSLVRNVRESAPDDQEHAALDLINEFIVRRTQRKKFSQVRSSGAWHTRIFSGQGRQSFAAFLSSLRLDTRDWNLEILSPYFDANGAAPLEALIEFLEPKEIRIHLPRNEDGTPRLSEASYRALGELATWSSLPGEITSRGRTEKAEKTAPRGVHAKVYRLWHGRGRDILIVGSVNLTSAGTSHSRAGNLEACFVVDATNAGYPRRWWLEPIDQPVEIFVEPAPEEGDGLEAALLPVSFRFDWANHTLAYRVDGDDGNFEVCEASGRHLFSVKTAQEAQWIECDKAASLKVEELLASTSFLMLRHSRGDWRVLIREESMGYRPSLLLHLTTEEIFEYWSLLNAEQRAAFLELRVGGSFDSLNVGRTALLDSRDTLFDRFAGIYHAFGCLSRHVELAIEEGQELEAEARLFGARYDSLPALLKTSLDEEDPDPIALYVTFLCAQQLRAQLAATHQKFFEARSQGAQQLDDLLKHTAVLREAIELGDDGAEFLDWYESAFLETAVISEPAQ